MREFELRYALDADDYARVLGAAEWSSPQRVCDLTFGPSGPRSMQVDGWVLRLRARGETASLEYKAPANENWTSWVEASVGIESASACAELLQLIGLKPGLLLDRTRQTATIEGVSLSLDEVLGLGRFIELEVADASDEEVAEAQIAQVRKLLMLRASSPIRPYGELLLEELDQSPDVREAHDLGVLEFLAEGVGGE